MNAEGAPWKILMKAMTTVAQTCSVLSYFNLALTSHTSDPNMDRAQLIYGIIMKMNMDLGHMILSQITQIVKSNSSRLGFPALITALCDAKSVQCDTLTFESLSLVINLMHIWKNCWNPAHPSVVFPIINKTQGHPIHEAPPAP